MRWELIGAVAAGVAIAGGIVAWPRPTLICLGLISLLLGLLGIATLKIENAPALGVAIVGGIALIGFGALFGLVEALLQETRRLSLGKRPEAANPAGGQGSPEARREAGKPEDRIEPKL